MQARRKRTVRVVPLAEELGSNHYDQRKKETVLRQAVKRLERLGYKVTVEAA